MRLAARNHANRAHVTLTGYASSFTSATQCMTSFCQAKAKRVLRSRTILLGTRGNRTTGWMAAFVVQDTRILCAPLSYICVNFRPVRKRQISPVRTEGSGRTPSREDCRGTAWMDVNQLERHRKVHLFESFDSKRETCVNMHSLCILI